MVIDPKECTGCGSCEVYCPVDAVKAGTGKTAKGKRIRVIDLQACVECGNCLRAAACPVNALSQQPIDWPRAIRSTFSNPQTPHKGAGMAGNMGRGTEEMKTNDVTHRFERGKIGIAVELGRPGIGASFRDVDRVTRAVAALGVQFEQRTPITALMEDRETGALRSDILDERVLSAIVEFKFPEEKLGLVLPALQNVASEIDTVFSLCAISVLPEEGQDHVPRLIKDLGFRVRPNGKVNLGLGRTISEQ